MTTDWAFFAWTNNESTAANASSVMPLSSASALVFGGGTRSDFASNISINTWNTAMHYGTSTASGSLDLCTDMHLWPLTPQLVDFTTRDTASLLAGVYVENDAGSPDPARGIGLRFRHDDFAVQVSPIQVWAATAPTFDNVKPASCYVAMVDLTSSVPTWSTVKPTAKLTLKPHGTAAEEHWWNIGVAILPLVVGHNGENGIKVSNTYY